MSHWVMLDDTQVHLSNITEMSWDFDGSQGKIWYYPSDDEGLEMHVEKDYSYFQEILKAALYSWTDK